MTSSDGKWNPPIHSFGQAELQALVRMGLSSWHQHSNRADTLCKVLRSVASALLAQGRPTHIYARSVEGTVNRLIGRRLGKGQHMCWSKRGNEEHTSYSKFAAPE